MPENKTPRALQAMLDSQITILTEALKFNSHEVTRLVLDRMIRDAFDAGVRHAATLAATKEEEETK